MRPNYKTLNILLLNYSIGLVVVGLLLLTSCGSKNKATEETRVNQIIDRPTTVDTSVRTETNINACESLQGELTCMCLDRMGYEACSQFQYENSNRWNECVMPYLESAYSAYCNINKFNSRGVQR